MVESTKEVSKYILQVLDEYTGALMLALPITQDDFNFIKIMGGNGGRTARSIIEEIRTSSPLKTGLDSEEATRREFSRRY